MLKLFLVLMCVNLRNICFNYKDIKNYLSVENYCLKYVYYVEDCYIISVKILFFLFLNLELFLYLNIKFGD